MEPITTTGATIWTFSSSCVFFSVEPKQKRTKKSKFESPFLMERSWLSVSSSCRRFSAAEEAGEPIRTPQAQRFLFISVYFDDCVFDFPVVR